MFMHTGEDTYLFQTPGNAFNPQLPVEPRNVCVQQWRIINLQNSCDLNIVISKKTILFIR